MAAAFHLAIFSGSVFDDLSSRKIRGFFWSSFSQVGPKAEDAAGETTGPLAEKCNNHSNFLPKPDTKG